jgi:hypothetical protein
LEILLSPVEQYGIGTYPFKKRKKKKRNFNL